MLLLVFNLGGERFGMDTSHVLEVAPAVPLTGIPGAPEFVPGFFVYRGRSAPVVDLKRFFGQGAAEPALSTRIILTRVAHKGREKVLGLLAERVTDTVRVKEEDLDESPVSRAKTPWFFGVAREAAGPVRLLAPRELLPGEILDVLFDSQEPGGEGDASHAGG